MLDRIVAFGGIRVLPERSSLFPPLWGGGGGGGWELDGASSVGVWSFSRLG